MKFIQRLGYYLIGILFGCMFLFFFLGKKKTSFCYFPNCRVLKDLRSKPITYSESAEQTLKQGWINEEDIRHGLTEGSVDFSQSKHKFENGVVYLIKAQSLQGEPLIIEMVNYQDRAVLKSVSKDTK